jgi:hypothetical protein
MLSKEQAQVVFGSLPTFTFTSQPTLVGKSVVFDKSHKDAA